MNLRETLEAEGGLIAAALGGQAPEYSSTEGSDPSVAVAAVREGQRLHTGAPRVVTRADPDLALLAGDRLYALGLELLATAGDLDGIAALAEVIGACAQAQADGDPAGAEAAWGRLDHTRQDELAQRPGA